MFLRNARWLRYCAMALLVLVVNLAGFWPLVSHSAARNIDIFQRYSEFMTATEALEQVIGGVEFCGDAPEPSKQPADWNAAPSQYDGKLILLGDAPSLPMPMEISLGRPLEIAIPGQRVLAPDAPPPRV